MFGTPRRDRATRLACLAVLLASSWAQAQGSVPAVMDAVIARLYANLSQDQLYALDDAQVQRQLLPEERHVLATQHWCFDADVPVTVSVLRNMEQTVIPFWLPESGFAKTSLFVKNAEGWTYEVWQKAFPAGRVELGINGFDEFRPHYLVCVGPQQPGAKPVLSGFHPAGQDIVEMKPGALTYHDWTELVLTEVPDVLRGQQLLPTTRGRAREACLVGAFRKTSFPSSERPGPVFLTWSEDPRTTQTVQWRTSATVADGAVRFREKGSDAAWNEEKAEYAPMDDRMLANDRYCHWFSAVLHDLKPGASYEYQVGSAARQIWSDFADFTTAPDQNKPFRFLYCSDTHNKQSWGDLLQATFKRYPDAAFCTISGDLVDTGLERDKWDAFLSYGEPMFRQRPLLPAIGNHDAQLGLGPGMYLEIMGLPRNGPSGIEPERAYTMPYANAQFFVLDVMSDAAAQREWLRQVLSASQATWKFAVFHFPLYLEGDEYADLEQNWAPLFDEYHVDLVFTGHVHFHARSYPLRAGKRVASPDQGTIYITSVSIPGDPVLGPKPDRIETWVGGVALCNVIEVDGNRCTFRAMTASGDVKDEFNLIKKPMAQ